ncbi:N-acetyltransferase [Peribacillus psychrosaccharolyticus]|uniref:N-acetyltransferase n=1 Tax=Peribacillus psychrosaccharolyticus TaxID=1407 RepID=A0A974NL00_PERPY|nr:GNAT family N-acetyltransferase [Peribacillus psychrosaccharolyticus]MEC2054626.1 GNAT family N-acetyltransferase [Peribacillus psychrosaccharolyticus]MED3744147.1 GNAT family N-acetyltransferase [Peribacillus psychrosaccharolyticus]QQS99638.1 N-acetyltransferase [Peribacillus psychrosaccharolyticus]
MDIQRGKQRFYVEHSGEVVAEITYTETGEKEMTIDHTVVSEELRGQKMGNKLVKKVVELAREENKKIIPACSFARKEFEKNQEYQDVLAE